MPRAGGAGEAAIDAVLRDERLVGRDLAGVAAIARQEEERRVRLAGVGRHCGEVVNDQGTDQETWIEPGRRRIDEVTGPVVGGQAIGRVEHDSLEFCRRHGSREDVAIGT